MNVLNVQQVERELRKIAAYAAHPQAARWVTSVARNYVLGGLSEGDTDANFFVYSPAAPPNPDMPPPSALPAWAKAKLAAGETLHWFDPIQVTRRKLWKTIQAIVDWFNTMPKDEKRLNRLDRISFPVAAYGAGRWTADVNANVWAYVKDKPLVIVRSENGFHWVQLSTQLHFEREGKLMNHCISGFGYFNECRSGRCRVFSLRDEFNTPHATLQVTTLPVSGSTVHQCKGNSNRKPDREYQRYIRSFIERQGWPIAADQQNID